MVGQQLPSYIDSKDKINQQGVSLLLSALPVLLQDNDLWPADALLHFPTAAVWRDMGEGESSVDHQAAELRGFVVEVVVCAEKARWVNTDTGEFQH